MPWVVRTLDVMRSAGCAPLLVVVGAAPEAVRGLLPADALAIENPDWASGMGGSLRAGLVAAATLPRTVDQLLVMMVDLPGVTDDLIRRFVAVASSGPASLAQASYDGEPGHPVLLGRDHWAPIADTASGDAGARDYLRDNAAGRVPLGTAADGADIDHR